MRIALNKGQRLWFTSDTHYNHANICSATTKWKDPVTLREFKTLEHMNSHLVGNIISICIRLERISKLVSKIKYESNFFRPRWCDMFINRMG